MFSFNCFTQNSYCQNSLKKLKYALRSAKWLPVATFAATAFSILVAPSAALAQRNFSPRFSTQARGRTTIFGNPITTCSSTIGPRRDICAATQQATTGSGIDFTNNGYWMDYVDIDSDGSTFNSSSVTYNFPTANPGFNIVWAGLYWAGETSAGAASGGIPAGEAAIDASKRNEMLLRIPGSSTYQTITASTLDTINTTRYSAFANVTSLVQQGGSGTYFGANIQTGKGRDRYGGWALIVVYQDDSEILRSMTVFDGFIQVGNNIVDTTISGFLTPNAGPFEAAFGAFISEGDVGLTGDQFLIDGDGANSDGDATDQPFVNISDANSPTTNFFNSSASLFETRIGTNTTVNTPDGKTLGPITRNPDYPNLLALDIDIVEAKDAANNAVIQNNATEAGLRFTSSGDFYYPTAFFFSVEVFQPVLTQNFTKTVTDINGGDLNPGDILEYTITYRNTGNDAATDVVLTDDIPTHTSYEPNSLVITTDPDPTLTTPAAMGDGTADNDRAEFDSVNNRVVFRTGIGANGTNGGEVPFDDPNTPIAENDTVQVKFRVKVDGDINVFPTTISNQAAIDYNGKFSGIPFSGVSDDPTTANDPNDPTDIDVVEATSPNLILVKRITRVNGSTVNGAVNLESYVDDANSPYDDNVDEIPPFAGQPDPNQDDTTHWPDADAANGPDDYLRGAIAAGEVKPGDEVEYTIYFLSTGGKDAIDVQLCDRVPALQTFVPDAYNAVTPAPSGGVGANRGIEVEYNGTILSYTNDADGDTAQYYPPGSTLPAPCNNAPAQSEDNGAVVLDLGTLPESTAPGAPTASYGALRFRAKVK